MAIFIQHSETSATGFELVDENKITPITTIIEDGRTLKLPKNSLNRSFVSKAKAEAAISATGSLILESTPASLGTKATGTSNGKAVKVDWSQYLDEADKKLYDELFVKATKKMRRAQIEAELAQLQAELNDIDE